MTLSDLERKKDYYRRAAEIGQFILNEKAKLGMEPTPWEDPNPNHYHGIIPDNGALLLEFDNGIPKMLLTPMGQWRLSDSSSALTKAYPLLKTELIKKLDLKLLETYPDGQEIYAVAKDLQDVPFHIPETANISAVTLDPAAAAAEWELVKPDLSAVAASSPNKPHIPVEGATPRNSVQVVTDLMSRLRKG